MIGFYLHCYITQEKVIHICLAQTISYKYWLHSVDIEHLTFIVDFSITCPYYSCTDCYIDINNLQMWLMPTLSNQPLLCCYGSLKCIPAKVFTSRRANDNKVTIKEDEVRVKRNIMKPNQPPLSQLSKKVLT